jgi:acyl carrier protein
LLRSSEDLSCLKIGRKLYKESDIWTIEMATTLRLPLRIAFPRAAVEARLRGALEVQAEDQAVLRDRAPLTRSARSSWEPEIDSLVVVELICAVEEQLGLKLPTSFAPREVTTVQKDAFATFWLRPKQFGIAETREGRKT